MRRFLLLLAAFVVAEPALAQTSGRLAVSGLSRPVTVLRDPWGIPHIYAETRELLGEDPAKWRWGALHRSEAASRERLVLEPGEPR